MSAYSHGSGHYVMHPNGARVGVFNQADNPHKTSFLHTGLVLLIIAAVAGVFSYTVSQRNLFAADKPQEPVQIPVPSMYTPNINPSDGPIAQTFNAADNPESIKLKNIIKQWQADYPSGQFGVFVQKLSDESVQASLNANNVFFTASLYKLYLANYVYNQIEIGKLTKNSNIGSSGNLNTCIQLMIRISSNACGESVGNAVGWQNLHNYTIGLGFKHTDMRGPLTSTAADTARFMLDLYKGKLLNKQHTNEFIELLKLQYIKNAIPAGVPGKVVANKTGDKLNVWHDAAVIYHPKGKYVLVVMTANAGPWPIANLSQRIGTIMDKY